MITIYHIGNSSCNRYKLSSLKVLTLTSNNVRYIDGNTPALLTWFTKSDLPVAGTFVLPRLELELVGGPSPGVHFNCHRNGFPHYAPSLSE